MAQFSPKLLRASAPIKFLSGNPFKHFLADGFRLRTIVLGGAFIQILLHSILPSRWASVPAIVLLLSAIIKTVFQALTPTTNAFMTGVVPGRTTAQLPSVTGRFGPDPASQGVVVFNLGIQWNHPLGFLAPGVKEVSQDFFDMNKELNSRREEFGLLGMSEWRGMERSANNTFLVTFHFRDVESVHKFAHEELHRRAWDRFNASKATHIGIFHETFVVPARSYESMYVNCHPLLLGRGMASCKDEKSGAFWANTLVDANTPQLKTQYARLGRDEQGNMKPEYLED